METRFAKNACWNFLIWSVCSSMGITVCTLIDAVLVGNFVGSEGLAVVNITTPVFLTYSLLGLTIGVGANVLIGRSLGASNVRHANRIFHVQLLAGLLIGSFCMILSVIFRDELCLFLGANDSLFPLAVQYLTVVFFSYSLFIIYHILSASVQTDGNPKLEAISSAVVIITNLSLDLLFLKGLGCVIFGASASLCIAEGMGIIVLLFHFVKKHTLLKLGLSIPRFEDMKAFVINEFGVGSAFIFQAVNMLIF